MHYSFRLAELLGHIPDPKKRPGTIKSIVEYTGLDRHQVAALLKNEVKYIPLKALSRLCDFLVEHSYATADQLPGALFAVEPEQFWELLARRDRLEMCLGVRRSEDDAFPAWVVAADSLLMGEVLNGVSTLGGTAKLSQSPADNGAPLIAPHPEQLKQSLAWSPGQVPLAEAIARAAAIHSGFTQQGGDKALVCLGSTKSNPVMELILAGLFGCEPFRSQDNVTRASDRDCPFYVRYRDNDPHPESCCGGTQLARDDGAQAPGLYYEQEDGTWGCCPSDGNTLDAAFVFYVYRESQGQLEMSLGGFSGRATRLLARALAVRAQDFWPAVHQSAGMQIGAFIVQFTIAAQENGSSTEDLLATDLHATRQVIPLHESVLERRLRRVQ